MRTIRIVTRAAAVVLAAVLVAGCPAAPRARPVKMGPAGTGPGSLEAARRQLEGKWELVTYQLVAADGKTTPVTGVGTLTLDAYGNISLDAHAETKTGKMLPISMQGRIVIDPQTQSFALADIDAAGQPLPSAQVSPDKRRFYAFQGDLLQLEIRDAAGKPTGRSAWRRLE